MDTQSVKNSDTAAQKSDDASKKVSGIKRYIAVDTQGLPRVMAVSAADMTDRKEAAKAAWAGSEACCGLLCNGSYAGWPLAQGNKDFLGEHVTAQIAKRSELHAFEMKP